MTHPSPPPPLKQTLYSLHTNSQVIKQLMGDRKQVVRPFVGMKMMTLTPSIIERERQYVVTQCPMYTVYEGGM